MTTKVKTATKSKATKTKATKEIDMQSPAARSILFIAKYTKKCARAIFNDYKSAKGSYLASLGVVILLMLLGVKVVSLATGATLWVATLTLYSIIAFITCVLVRSK